MKYFYFHSPNTEWDKQLTGHQCEANSINGNRCKRKVVIGLPLCYQHTASIYKLKVKKSNIPNAGMGIFAMDKTKGENDIVFKKDKLICPYFGEIIDGEELRRRYGKYLAPYGIKIKNETYMDGALQRGIGSILNHKNNRGSNCKFSNNYKTINIKSIKNIRNGDELFVNYGDEYDMSNPIKYKTYNSRKRN